MPNWIENKSVKFTILGKPPSKSNCYQIIRIKNHGSLTKTKALKEYEQAFYMQVPEICRENHLSELLTAKVAVYYPSNRSDLDNALKVIFDCLEKSGVIKNDNQIVEIHATKHIDKLNPRVELEIIKK